MPRILTSEILVIIFAGSWFAFSSQECGEMGPGFVLFLPVAIATTVGGLLAIAIAIMCAIRNRKRIGLRAFLPLTICLATVALFYAVYPHGFSRSIFGRYLRCVKGEPGAVQIVNDLSENLRSTRAMSELQPWAVSTLERFKTGGLKTEGTPVFALGNDRLTKDEIPAFIKDYWGVNPKAFPPVMPEVSILRARNGQPDVIVIGWSTLGILAGPANFKIGIETYTYIEYQNGVYIYESSTGH